MTRHDIERLENAESELTVLYWDLRDPFPYKMDSDDTKIVKRLDTILGKLNELKYLAYKNLTE